MLRDLSALTPCSLLADCAHVIGMLVVLKDDVEQLNVAHEALVLSKGASALPFLFGVSIYCYEGISMILPLEESMAEKSKVQQCPHYSCDVSFEPPRQCWSLCFQLELLCYQIAVCKELTTKVACLRSS